MEFVTLNNAWLFIKLFPLNTKIKQVTHIATRSIVSEH
jgi:hypothetical protein